MFILSMIRTFGQPIGIVGQRLSKVRRLRYICRKSKLTQKVLDAPHERNAMIHVPRRDHFQKSLRSERRPFVMHQHGERSLGRRTTDMRQPSALWWIDHVSISLLGFQFLLGEIGPGFIRTSGGRFQILSSSEWIILSIILGPQFPFVLDLMRGCQ